MTMTGIGPGTPGAAFVEDPPSRERWVMLGVEVSRRLLAEEGRGRYAGRTTTISSAP